MKEIQKRITEKTKRGALSRFVHATNDKEMIAAWNSELNRILQVFNVCSDTSV